MRISGWTVLLTATCVVLGGMALPDAAQAQKKARDKGFVKACSRYGNGCVTGPTRPGRFDREVRMPGGTWIPCKQDCRETLREETVDFWETINERAPGNQIR